MVELDRDGRLVRSNAPADRLLGDQLRPGAAALPLLARAGGSWTLTITDTGADAAVSACLVRRRHDDVALRHAATQGFLARTITHDLNNLFTCILACATAPERGLRERERDLTAIRQAVERGAELLGVLHELRLDASGGACRVAEVVAGCGFLLQRVGERCGVQVVTDSGAPDLIAAIEAFELQQLLINLGLNAIEAMPGGGVLTLHAEAHPAGVKLTVGDDGPGIAHDRLGRVFDPGVSTKGGHSGLGLVVVRQLVARAGGEIAVDSALGRGTRFVVIVPSAEARP